MTDRADTRKSEQHGLFAPLVHDRRAVGSELGHPGLAPVEQVDGGVDDRDRLGIAGIESILPLPEVLDLRFEISHGQRRYPNRGRDGPARSARAAVRAPRVEPAVAGGGAHDVVRMEEFGLWISTTST